MQIKTLPLTSGWRQSRLRLEIFILFCMFNCVPGTYSAAENDAIDPAKDSATNISNVSSLDRLHADLFIHYDKMVPPMVGGKGSNINLGMTAHYFDVDELNGKFIMHCWLNIDWMDELFTWNASEFDNITYIQLQSHEIWKPQITLFNAAGYDEGDGTSSLQDSQVILMSNGKFIWIPPAIYTAYCNLNMRDWPYDQQHCKLKIGSWSRNNKIQADFTKLDQSSAYAEALVPSTEWEVVTGQAKYVTEDYYHYIEYSFTVQRRSSMYTAIIYTPASCIVILTLAAFWLPPKLGGEKIMVNGLLIILIAAFLMYFAQLLPILAENTPLVVIFYSSSLLLVSWSTIIEVLVLYLATTQHKRRIPEFLKKVLDGPLGTCLLLSHFTFEGEQSNKSNEKGKREMEEHIYESSSNDYADADPLYVNPIEIPSSQAIQFDWVLLATALDRISFLIFSLIFTVLAIVCAV
ncbi:neuronal acetylcholine receptor subunit alpha-2 [Drosophila tropicalis]|uniref:neuronal acetylcholine receptor subunit alpha-2 n=1 Tax=Drosophila tropicalis TaxID=46794 RepID=UPI0035AB999C